MIQVFSGVSADTVWRQVAAALVAKGTPTQSSRAGQTTEILHAGLSLEDPRQRWATSRRPAINPAFALAEVVWILTGRRDAAFLHFFNREYEKHAGPGPLYHGAYGWRLRSHFGYDQLIRAYESLKNNPDSRQVVLQLWDSTKDMPDADGQPVSQDVPCNIISMLKMRGGALEWTQVLRSNDAFKGLPYNLVQFTTLQEVMAGWLGADVGTYNQLSDSLHVYEADLGSLAQVDRGSSPPNTDDLAVAKHISDSAFCELAARTERLIVPNLTSSEFREASMWRDGPTAHSNILRVIAAESARRHGWSDLAEEVMAGCSNPAFSTLWRSWTSRLHDAKSGGIGGSL